MRESTHTGNKGNHQITAEMLRVESFHYLTHMAGQQRHTGTWALLGLVHPSEKAQAPIGLVHPRAQ